MSIKSHEDRPSAPQIRRRRSAEEARSDALAAARALLVECGPGSVTLKAVGAASGMSHANLIHHFGSADDLRSELMNAMVRELTGTIAALIERKMREELPVEEVVGRVFDAYADGGIGLLAAWLALTGSTERIPELTEAIGNLVSLLAPLKDQENPTHRAYEDVWLVTMLAFADSLIGKHLASITGTEKPDMRDLTLRLLDALEKGA